MSSQVIHVGDTGLNFDNCYFSDANASVSTNGSTMTNHRKLVF
jgi:hypothetical protein